MKLLDEIIRRHKLVSDAHLARYLGVSSATICHLRTGQKELSARMVLAIYDKTTMTIEEIRRWAAKK